MIKHYKNFESMFVLFCFEKGKLQDYMIGLSKYLKEYKQMAKTKVLFPRDYKITILGGKCQPNVRKIFQIIRTVPKLELLSQLRRW